MTLGKYDDMNIETFCNEMGCTISEFNNLVDGIRESGKYMRCTYTDEELINLAKSTFFGDGAGDITAKEADEYIKKTITEYENKNIIDCMCNSLMNMSIDEFCEAVGITKKKFNKKLKKAKKFLGYQPKYICIRFTKLSFCPHGVCCYCGEYLSKMIDKADEKWKKELKELADSVPDCAYENTGWELPSNSPEYKRR